MEDEAGRSAPPPPEGKPRHSKNEIIHEKRMGYASNCPSRQNHNTHGGLAVIKLASRSNRGAGGEKKQKKSLEGISNETLEEKRYKKQKWLAANGPSRKRRKLLHW